LASPQNSGGRVPKAGKLGPASRTRGNAVLPLLRPAKRKEAGKTLGEKRATRSRVSKSRP